MGITENPVFWVGSKAIPYVPRTFSDDELARVIETSYPNLNGALLELFTRFCKGVDDGAGLSGITETHSCPHCGSDLHVKVK